MCHRHDLGILDPLKLHSANNVRFFFVKQQFGGQVKYLSFVSAMITNVRVIGAWKVKFCAVIKHQYTNTSRIQRTVLGSKIANSAAV
jgi:hypothetical protein